MATFADLPPFPEDVPTHPLLVIDFDRIEAGDDKEIDKLFGAAKELGFWYLKNHGADELAEEMFEMGAETMRLPLEEKNKYEQGDEGTSFGYKAAGANAVDEHGNLDLAEFINISKDDALAYPQVVHRRYPPPTEARMESTVRPFVRRSMYVNDTLLDVLGEKLGLLPNALRDRHRVDEPSGSETRCIKNPPRPPEMSESRSVVGAHTDFGSLSFLHNRLGGLQVRRAGTDEWQYIKPIPGHAICNVGDALNIFSGGIMRSNLHRVVNPPGIQSRYERWSLVYFTRPGRDVRLQALVEESPLIAEAAKTLPSEKVDTGSSAGQWFARRIRNQRIKNRTGPETWHSSRGTEHQPQAV